MSLYGKVSIVVTGVDGLEKTAQFIQRHFKNANQEVPILHWDKSFKHPQQKPYILIVPERSLAYDEITKIHGDVIVIKNISEHSEELENKYLKLFSGVGPHVNTVINADDRASVALVKSDVIKKSRYFYYSKNGSLEKQIEKNRRRGQRWRRA